MAFDQTTRNRLARFVSDTRALLTEEFTRQLQNEYGLDPASGEVTPIERLTALDDSQRETARIIRETLDYYLAGNPKADAKAFKDVLDRIVREQAFTVLNRLCALRMSEARGLVLESIAKGYQSKGFQLYARLAGSALGETGEAYCSYLLSLMDEFAVDLPILFDRFSPQGRLFPREAALLKLLELINDPEIEPLWTEDETIGWIYQYFNSKEERKTMRDASQSPRNSRELAVRNQFFTPRYVVEFLTDNTLGRIWYEMTRSETALIDSCRYLVRRKYAFFLAEGQTVPEPFLPEQQHETDPDLAHEMWLPPNDQISDLETIFLYAMTAGGYDYAREQWGIECGDLANEKLKQYHETGKWEGTFDELRCCLFFEQRRYHHFGEGPEGDDAKSILELYQAICERWNLEVEFIPHRPLKDPREIKMLDPACGSMHFGLYAFDLFEQIYVEAWELEESLGEDALQRLADLEPIHKTYSDKESYLKDVPRLIIERNIHGVDIDPRAVQIAGLSLWLRAQKSWQVQGLRPAQRPQIRKSNVVCAEPMPGDRQMLEEFLTTMREDKLEAMMRKAWHIPSGQKVKATKQMTEALIKLVRTVWQEMELAGEAGSLLKIEETLREAIASARKESEEKSPLFRVLEYGLGEPAKERAIQIISGNEQDFFDRSEGLVLTALKDYAEQTENKGSYQRHLFNEDAVKGFAFIDLCRKNYDVVLMNPPFGEPSIASKQYISSTYPETKYDLYAMFVLRWNIRLNTSGTMGAITNKTGFFLQSFENWRENISSYPNKLAIAVDLGYGVLDTAMVATMAYTINKSSDRKECSTCFIRLTYEENKQNSLMERLQSIINGNSIRGTWLRKVSEFSLIPYQPMCYWAKKEFIDIFNKFEAFSKNSGHIYQGIATGDNTRFLRCRWEIPIEGLERRDWITYAKGGESILWFSDFRLVVQWAENGKEMKANAKQCYGSASRTIKNEFVFYKPGITYTQVTNKGFSARVMPQDCIFDMKGPLITINGDDLYTALGVFSSFPIRALAKLITDGRQWHPTNLMKLPFPKIEEKKRPTIRQKVSEIINNIQIQYTSQETSSFFTCPSNNVPYSINNNLAVNQIDNIIADCFGTDLMEFIELDKLFTDDQESSDNVNSSSENQKWQTKVISYLIGCVFGRWDIRFLTLENKSPKPPEPFFQLPIYPLGMLLNNENKPIQSGDELVQYPIKIAWNGISCNDIGHPRNLTKSIRELLGKIYAEKAEEIEQIIINELGCNSIESYINSSLGFFDDHLKEYSESHRQAPIYWAFSTPSCSYTLWLYYHRLNDQTLYTCVNDFVDPKLKQVSEEAARLRLKKSRSATDEKELEHLTDFERELKDFREELLRAAKFWKPNLNDGVEITAAPLWKLFQHKPWQKRLKETWQKLEAGEYDWAHLAYSIWPDRVREKCMSDKSLAIAHDLESLYLEPPVAAKKKIAKKKTSDEESEGWFNDD